MFKKYATTEQLDRVLTLLSRRIDKLEFPRPEPTYVYDAIIALLVEAGILIEDDKVSKGWVTRNNKTYRVKKVK